MGRVSLGRSPWVLWGSVLALLFWSCLGIPPLLAVPSSQAPLQRLLRKAHSDEGQGNYRAAEQIYKKALRLFPNDPVVLKSLGILYQTELKFQSSIKLFQRILASKPDYPQVNFYLGVSYFGLNNFKQAINSFHRELRTPHPCPPCRYYLALALESSGQPESAITELDKVVAKDPKDAGALYQLARLHMEASFEATNMLRKLDPNSYELNALMGEIYADEQQYPQAIKEYQAALKKRPGATGIHYAIGIAEWQQKQFRAAKKEFQEALQELPNDPLTNLYLGDIEVQEGHFRQAIPYLQRAQEGQPRMMQVHLLLGRCYEATGNLEKAREQLLLACQLEPNVARPHYILAQVYRELHKPDKSRDELALFKKLSSEQQNETLEKAQNIIKRQQGKAIQ